MLSLSPTRLWAPFAVAGLGVWLQFAPLIFWAPTAVNYLNDTSCGAIVILLSIIIPGTPGGKEPLGNEIPPGWSYNPSSWSQRLPVIAMAFFAWMSARYMAAYQLGYIDHIWDPVFHNGTLRVITSDLSKSFPISDAGLGALIYTMEVLMGFKGRTRRWYTMPWMVLLFGIMVIPAGFVSILLIMLQPLIVGYWCFWCLFTAVCMLVMIALSIDEVIAVLLFLADVKKNKGPFWKIFWKGGEQVPYPEIPYKHETILHSFYEMKAGVTFPWNLIVSVLLGGILMFGPSSLSPLFSDIDHVVGALVATIAFIAMAEPARAFRFVNIPLAIIILVCSFVFREYFLFHFFWSLILIAVCLSRGKILQKYGNWDRFIF